MVMAAVEGVYKKNKLELISSKIYQESWGVRKLCQLVKARLYKKTPPKDQILLDLLAVLMACSVEELVQTWVEIRTKVKAMGAADDDADSTLSSDSRANSFSSDTTAEPETATPVTTDDEVLGGVAAMSLDSGAMDESQAEASRDEASEDDEVMVVGDTPARPSLEDLPLEELQRRLDTTSKQLHSARMRQLKRHFKFHACKKRVEGLLSRPHKGPKVTFVDESPVRPFQYAMDTDETQIDEPDTEALATVTDPEPEALGTAITDGTVTNPEATEALGTTDTEPTVTPTPNGTPSGSMTSGGEPDTEVSSCVAVNLFPEVPDGYVTRRDQLAMRPKKDKGKGKGKGAKKGKGESSKPAKLSRTKSSKKLGKLKRMNAKSNQAFEDEGDELGAGAVEDAMPSEPSSSSMPKPKKAPKRKALPPTPEIEDPQPKRAPKRKALPPTREMIEDPQPKKRAPKRKALPPTREIEDPAPKRRAAPPTREIEDPAPKRRAAPPTREIEEPSVTAPKGLGRGGKVPRFASGFGPEDFQSNLKLDSPVNSMEAAAGKLLEIMHECTRAGGHTPNTSPQFPLKAPVRLSVYWKKPAVGVKVERFEGCVVKTPQLHFVSWKSPCICTQIYVASQLGNAEWWYTVQRDNQRDRKVNELKDMLMQAHTSAVRTFTGENDE
ncbi:unnamed protein product [Symbiodinium sp. CCMP2592]|nr:unnamed protein product [Symbiodinium sp. CCMP2592]